MKLSKLMTFKKKVNIYTNVNLSKDKGTLALILVATVANGLVPAITSILTGRLFDLLSNLVYMNSLHDAVRELANRSFSIMALGAASFPIMWISISMWMWLGEKQGFRIRDKLVNSYIDKPLEWYDLNTQLLGDFTQVNRCIEELRSSSAEASAITFQNFVAVISLIGVSFYYSWSLTLIILCSSPVVITVAVIFSRLINKYTALENTESARTAEIISFSMSAVQLVKLYSTQKEELFKFMNSSQKCNTYFIKSCLYVSTNTSILRFLTLCMFVQGFWFGSTMIKKGVLTITDVITCFHSCLMLGSTLNNTLQQIVVLQKGDVAIKKIENISCPTEKSTLSSVHFVEPTLDISDCNISFDNVSFSYPSRPTERILKKISAVFVSGKTTYVIGKSGSGKSTLSNLLLKFYKLDNGAIYIGDKNISSISQDWIIKNVTIVEQRCTLFNDTLRNNILLGLSNIKDSSNAQLQRQLEESCRFALLDRLISTLPDGLDTKLGADGITLSGGQQQRVALARAFMRNTPILILDEAVSALDLAHRKAAMRAIKKWRQNKTTIILTHQLDEIESNDFVYVIKDGAVIQKGLQMELLRELTGPFYSLYDIQVENDKNIKDTNSIVSDDSSDIIDISDAKRKESVHTDTSSDFISVDEKSAFTDSIDSKNKINQISLTKRSSLERSSTDGNVEINDEDKIMPLKMIIKRMVKSIRHKKLLFSGIIASLFAGATNPIFSYTFSYLLNGIVPSSENNSYYLLKWSFIVLGVSVADGVFNFLKSFILGYTSEYWIMDLRNEAMSSIVGKKLYWFSKDTNKSSEISALLMNDLRDLRSLVSEFLSAMSTFIVVSSLGLIWALVSGWKLSLVCISMFPLIIIFSSIYGGLLQKYETNYKSSVAILESCHHEIVTNMKAIRGLQAENHFLSLHQKHKSNLQAIAKKRAVATGVGIAITNAITMCIQAILYYYGLKLVLEGEYSSKKMFQTFTLLLFTIMTCTSLISQIPDIARGQRAASWIYRIIEEDKEWSEEESSNGRLVNIGDIEPQSLVKIDNLSFSYPSAPDVEVYGNLHLTLPNMGSTAIVGESGSGKSTLISLLTKLYQVNDKSIYIDNTDINEWDTAKLRSQISVVEQKPVLIHGSLRDNLTYGISNNNITDMELYDILKFVDIFDFLSELSNGLDTRITSDLLSGGQAQRLCIARALLRKSKLLILDECTSALDAKSSQTIRNIVNKGLSGVSIICITHSKSMMQCCNKIIVLKDGHVLEEGSYEKLNVPGKELNRIVASDI